MLDENSLTLKGFAGAIEVAIGAIYEDSELPVNAIIYIIQKDFDESEKLLLAKGKGYGKMKIRDKHLYHGAALTRLLQLA